MKHARFNYNVLHEVGIFREDGKLTTIMFGVFSRDQTVQEAGIDFVASCEHALKSCIPMQKQTEDFGLPGESKIFCSDH